MATPGIEAHPSRRMEVEPFDRDAYEQFRLPTKLGNPISCLDDPEMVPGSSARHMRPDDYVIGLTLAGASRAYPLWIIDHYHAVNDRVGERRFVVASCERCQSGAAYLSELPVENDREPLFRGIGVLNAVLLFKDIKTGTWWSHYEGLGLRGRMAGLALPLIPTYHMEWADWLSLHPDTTVMATPDDPAHPDARHGHGREEFFSRPGIEPMFVPTISGPFDTTYPENEMVLAVDLGDGWVAYPLREVQREGGVVHEMSDQGPVAIFAGPRADGFTMSAFRASAGSEHVTFRRAQDAFIDDQTRSRWSIEGVAQDGPLAGTRLEPLRWFYVRWHAWVYLHRETKLFVSRKEAPSFGTGSADPGVGTLGPVLDAVSTAGHDVRVEGPVVSQRRPRESVQSLVIRVDGDRVNLHRFGSEVAARDYETLEGAWSGFPLRARVLASRLRRMGSLIVESDPDERFADPVQSVPLPRSVVRWAAVLSSSAIERLGEIAEGWEADEPTGRMAFRDVVRGLRTSGFEVIDVGFLPFGQLRVGCVNGIALTIQGDRFLLYRFESAEQALAYAATIPRGLPAGPFVLRSTPEMMYLGGGFEILYAGDDRIEWSSLLDDERFVRTFRGACGGSANR